jgi:parallel beta-helix repeat protein
MDAINLLYQYVYDGHQQVIESGVTYDILYDVTFDQELNVKAGDHLISLDTTGSGMTIRNSEFGYSRARGILVRGQNVIIENCTFENTLAPAIKIQPELSWCEGGFSSNVTIRNNTIKDCGIGASMIGGSTNFGTIVVGIEPTTNITSGLMNCWELKDIVIEDNVIENTNAYGISATNGDGITIRNNEIINCLMTGEGVIAQDRVGVTASSGILVAKCKNVLLEGNSATSDTVELTAVEQCVDVTYATSGSSE